LRTGVSFKAVNATIPSSSATSIAAKALRSASPELCLFHDGLATLDLFLAELDPADRTLFDAALDLRSLAAGTDAAACIEQLFRVRTLLDARHYLAFYRVRCWARRTFRIEVRAQRGATAIVRDFPLDGGRLDEVVNSALAAVASDGDLPAAAYVRFVFAGTRA
jgi:hypothetical protein